jgi:hypothetical protein
VLPGFLRERLARNFYKPRSHVTIATGSAMLKPHDMEMFVFQSQVIFKGSANNL